MSLLRHFTEMSLSRYKFKACSGGAERHSVGAKYSFGQCRRIGTDINCIHTRTEKDILVSFVSHKPSEIPQHQWLWIIIVYIYYFLLSVEPKQNSRCSFTQDSIRVSWDARCGHGCYSCKNNKMASASDGAPENTEESKRLCHKRKYVSYRIECLYRARSVS